MSHRRICYCCGCEYFSDRFDRDEIGGNWSDVDGWELKDTDDGKALVATSDASIRCLKEHPQDLTNLVIAASLEVTRPLVAVTFSVDNVSVRFAAGDVSSTSGAIQIIDGGEKLREYNWSANPDGSTPWAGIKICISNGWVHVFNDFACPVTHPSSSTVTIDAEVPDGEVRLLSFSLSWHKDDRESCPDCIPRERCEFLDGEEPPVCLSLLYPASNIGLRPEDAKWCNCPNDYRMRFRRTFSSGTCCEWQHIGPGGAQYANPAVFRICQVEIDGERQYRISLEYPVLFSRTRWERVLGKDLPSVDDLYLPMDLVYAPIGYTDGSYIIPTSPSTRIQCGWAETISMQPSFSIGEDCKSDDEPTLGPLARFCPCNRKGVAGLTIALTNFGDTILFPCTSPSYWEYIYHLGSLNGSVFCPWNSPNPQLAHFLMGRQWGVPLVEQRNCSSGSLTTTGDGSWTMRAWFRDREIGEDAFEWYWVVEIDIWGGGFWFDATYESDPIPPDWDICSASSTQLHLTSGPPEFSGNVTITQVVQNV